jgi:uncharacterized damage-inducible protein DinB
VDVSTLLLDLYGRIPPLAREAVAGLDVDRLMTQPAPGTNTIAWLVWHLTRIQDCYVSEYLGTDQIWVGSGWAAHFGLEPDPSNHGYGHAEADMLSVRPERPEVLIEYLDAVDQRVRSYLTGLTPDDLDRVIDPDWDPPVTLGVRLISIADDGLQHVGQAAYLRGLLDR